LKPLKADDISTEVVKGALARSGVDSAAIDMVILGHCRQTSDDPNIARLTALRSGIPESVPAYTVMAQCVSGMTAVMNAATYIMSGQADAVLAGGTESMSNAVFYFRDGRFGIGTRNTELLDALVEAQLRSQPQDIYGVFNMGITAENVAEKYGVTREEQDAFAYASQCKALEAIRDGKFRDEIVPIEIPQRKKPPIIFDTDEFPRETSPEALAALKPVFKTDGAGTVTAGNSSGRNDGAAALILMARERAEALGQKPLAVIRGSAMAGVDPRIMGIGPVPASEKALGLAGLSADDIGLVELNEAFAAQSLGCLKNMSYDPEIVNVNGGAIALGHPLGCTGARISVTLLHEMKKRNVRYGLATLCVAGGMGGAMIFENVT
jgi:acetyl-CoA C-acetyltransferase